ncbi:Hypothetical protein, putative, partial [Bodo saltans]
MINYLCVATLLTVLCVPCESRVSLPLLVSTVTSANYPYGLDISEDGTLIFATFTMCAIHKMPPLSRSSQVIAGAYGTCGFANGVGSSARFNYPSGMARDAANNVMYIADPTNNRIRVMNLATYSVTTLIGSVEGFLNGPFSSALLKRCTDVAFHSTSSGLRVLYVTDWYNDMIRKADLTTSTVSTLAATPGCVNSVLSRSGLLLYYVSNGGTISSVDTTTGTVTLMAGVYGAYGIVDAVGTTARFGQLRGAALNHDETILYIGDQLNCRLRQLVISSLRVTTAAGTGVASSVNGPRLSSTFVGPSQAKWYCNRLTSICGLMVADSATGGAIRWVPITPASISMSASAPTIVESNEATLSRSSTKRSATPNASASSSHSSSVSLMRWTTHTVVASNEVTLTRSLSLATWTGDATVTMSRWPSESAALSFSRAVSNTKHSASPTPTRQQTWTALVEGTSTMSPSASHTLTPSVTSTSDVTATKSQPTRTKSSTMFDCDAQAPQATGVMLVRGVNSSTNTSAPLALLGANSFNATYAPRKEERVPPLVFLTSLNIDRVALLQEPPLAFNLTLVSPFQLLYYYVGNVTTLQGTSTSATWSVRPRSGEWHGVVVQPPSIGWVGDVIFPVLLYREMSLLVPLMCGDGRAMLTVALTVPSPGVPRDL